MNIAQQVQVSVETELARHARALAAILRCLSASSAPPNTATRDLLEFADRPELDDSTHDLFDRAIALITELTATNAAAARTHPIRAHARPAFPLRLLSWLLLRRSRRPYILPADRITRLEQDIQAQLAAVRAHLDTLLPT